MSSFYEIKSPRDPVPITPPTTTIPAVNGVMLMQVATQLILAIIGGKVRIKTWTPMGPRWLVIYDQDPDADAALQKPKS